MTFSDLVIYLLGARPAAFQQAFGVKAFNDASNIFEYAGLLLGLELSYQCLLDLFGTVSPIAEFPHQYPGRIEDMNRARLLIIEDGLLPQLLGNH